MNTAKDDGDRRAERLVAVLDTYLAEAQAGRAPSAEALLARHPDLARELEECLGSLDFICRQSETTEVGPGVVTGGILGDFRLVREIGRGGMGVVFEAEQVSLGRRVALKVLPFAAVFDERHLQRFRNEAHAAAQLHHTNIVPIHAVGTERGIHYYAMQYIEGRSLAQIIAELRTHSDGNGRPPREQGATGSDPLTAEGSTQSQGYCRTVSQLGIQAAEALEHAHRLGIIHRDVKPANLLLDARGHLWITDFGLAVFRTEARGLTVSGDVVGTLRYMSPEQASSNRPLLDHRTDVYSLGVTLYELLTLEKAVPGDEASPILAAIATRDVPSARRRNPAVSAEMDTILAKAMAKSPNERYHTAQDLADDLRRLLDHRPIRARRPTPLQRAAKWLRRHPAVVWSAILVLAIAVGALLVSTITIRDAYEAEAAARKTAEDNRDRARAAVERMLSEVAEKDLAHVPQMELIRRRLLAEALTFYESFLREDSDDPAIRRETAHAYRRMGDILQELGRFPKAVLAYRKALDVMDALPPEVGGLDRVVVQRSLSEALYDLHLRPPPAQLEKIRFAEVRELVEAARDGELGAQAVVAAEEAVARADAWAKEAVDPQRVLWERGLCAKSLGFALMSQDASRALGVLQHAASLFERLVSEGPDEPTWAAELAATRDYLGYYYRRHDRRDEAEEELTAALEIYEALVAKHDEVPEYRWRLATTCYALADMLRLSAPRQGGERREEAGEVCRRALDLAKELERDHPRVPRYRGLLGDSVRMLALFHQAGNDFASLEALYEEGLRILPSDALTHVGLAMHLTMCRDVGRRDLPRAIATAETATQLAPHGYECWAALGIARYRSEDYAGAAEALEKATSLRSVAPSQGPLSHGSGHFRCWLFLAMANWQVGEKDEAQACFERGVDALERNFPKRPKHRPRKLRVEAATLLGIDDD